MLPHLAPMKNILIWVNMVSETTICLSKTTFNIKNVKKKNVVAFLYGKNKDVISLAEEEKVQECLAKNILFHNLSLILQFSSLAHLATLFLLFC